MRWIVVGAVCAVLFALPGTASAATTCTPSAAHPYPVVLVHGTFENASMWAAVAPQIRAAGYCVFALNYGNNATGDIPTSAAQLGSSWTRCWRRPERPRWTWWATARAA